MNMEVIIVQIWRYTSRLLPSELGDALRDRDLASFVMYLKAMIV